MPHMKLFQHGPIHAHEIRLFQLIEGDDNVDEICCVLTIYDRTKCPPYEVLTHADGDRHACVRIHCNERFLPVTRACNDALLSVQQRLEPDERNDAPFFWTREICVNEDDDAEKSADVVQMSLTFGRAARTLVDLGASDAASEFMQDLFKMSYDQAIARSKYKGGAELSTEWKNRFHECLAEFINGKGGGQSSAAEESRESLWFGLFHSLRDGTAVGHWNIFFGRPYFRRLWSVPEVLLSRNIVLLCGGHDIPWRMLASGLATIRECDDLRAICNLRDGKESETHTDEKDPVPSSMDLALPMPVTMRIDLGFIHGGKGKSAPMMGAGVRKIRDYSSVGEYHAGLRLWRLFDLLKSTNRLECQDGRDKLFALTPLFEKPTPQLLATDYSKSEAQVFTDLSWFLINSDVSAMFPLTGCEPSRGKVPSWVVNWSAHPAPRFVTDGVEGDYLGAGVTADFNRMIARREGDVLTLRGKRITHFWENNGREHEADGWVIVESKELGETEPEPFKDYIEQMMVVFLGARDIFTMKRVQDGWKIVDTMPPPDMLRDGEILREVDWNSVDAEWAVAPLEDFPIY